MPRAATQQAIRHGWIGAAIACRQELHQNISMRFLIATLAAFSLAACSPAGSKTKPESESAIQPPGEALRLQGRVSDAAGVLFADAEARISANLAVLENDTHHQIVVVTTPSLGGADIAAYTDALGNRWGIGRKSVNDGAVIMLAPNEKEVRISVGDGLRARLSDDFCKSLINQSMIPEFKSGAYAKGLEAALAAISNRLKS